MVGFSVSFAVTVKVQVLVLPEASVAVQVTVVVPLAKLEPEAGEQLVVTPGQLSLAVGLKVTVCAQVPGAGLVKIFAGQVIVGFSVSFTVTVKVQVLVLLEASVAVQVTVVVPLA